MGSIDTVSTTTPRARRSCDPGTKVLDRSSAIVSVFRDPGGATTSYSCVALVVSTRNRVTPSTVATSWGGGATSGPRPAAIRNRTRYARDRSIAGTVICEWWVVQMNCRKVAVSISA